MGHGPPIALRSVASADCEEPRDTCGQPQCPACSATDPSIRLLGTSDEYSLLQCDKCGLRYSNPMLAADDHWYEASNIYATALAWRELLTLTSRPRRWEFRQGLAALNAGGKKVLDLGCGCGEFLFYAQRAGCQVTGLDFNSSSVEFARKELGISSVYDLSLQDFLQRFPDGKFDAISIFEVLEHASDPGAILRAARGILEEAGSLLVSVPGYQRWPALFDPEVDAPPHHLTMWTEEALQAILERAGFMVVAIQLKPLEAGDLGIHLKWILGRLWRNSLWGSRRSPVEVTPSSGRHLRTWVRNAVAVVLGMTCRLLRLYPRAGGFTLFAHARIGRWARQR